MKRFCMIVSIVLLLSVDILSMTTPPKDEIPIPKENISASIVDIDNVATSGKNISINGFTYLSAKRGATDVYIPLERIKNVLVKSISEEKVTVEITLDDSTIAELTADGKDEIAGQASFGQFRVRLNQIKTLEITDHSINPPKEKK